MQETESRDNRYHNEILVASLGRSLPRDRTSELAELSVKIEDNNNCYII